MDLSFWNVLVCQQKSVLRSTKITSFGQCPAVQEYDPTTKRLTLVRNTELEFLDAPGFIPVGFGRRFSKDMRKFLSARDHSFSIFLKTCFFEKFGQCSWNSTKKRGSSLICETVACWPLMCFRILFLRTPGEDDLCKLEGAANSSVYVPNLWWKGQCNMPFPTSRVHDLGVGHEFWKTLASTWTDSKWAMIWSFVWARRCGHVVLSLKILLLLKHDSIWEFTAWHHDIWEFWHFCEFSCHSCGKRIRRWWRELQLGAFETGRILPIFSVNVVLPRYGERPIVSMVWTFRKLSGSQQKWFVQIFFFEWRGSFIFDWNCYCQRSCISGGLWWTCFRSKVSAVLAEVFSTDVLLLGPGMKGQSCRILSRWCAQQPTEYLHCFQGDSDKWVMLFFPIS